jgi:Tfp pilus assembly protein PilF
MRTSFLRKITPTSPSKHRLHVTHNKNTNDTESRQDASSIAREKRITKQMHESSINQYIRGVEYLQRNLHNEAKECFEDALAARLVLHGPDSDEVLAAHHQLRWIAKQQGDVRKAAHHKAKIVQVQNARVREKYQRFASDKIDWSVLCDKD